jgi:hypothetical protein
MVAIMTTATQDLVKRLLTGTATANDTAPGMIIDIPDEAADDYLDTVEKQLRRQVDLNGQETWQDTQDQAPPAAGGGAMTMPPVPGGVPGFTAGAEPPRWDGSSPQPRVLSAPDDADDGMYPDAGRVRSERPHAAFPSGPQGMDGYWPQGQPQPQAGYQSPGGKRDVPPSTVGAVNKVGPDGYIHGWIKVNPGDTTPQDPVKLQQAVDDWIGLGGKRKKMVKPADVLAALKGESDNESANILAKELKTNSRPAKEIMYRGISVKPSSRVAKKLLSDAKRGTIDLGPSSFSEDEEIAHDFMGDAYEGSGKIGIQINVRKMTGVPMKSSANQLDMGGYTEREWLTGGRYKVTSVTGPVPAHDGFADGGYLIEVEQTHGFGDS